MRPTEVLAWLAVLCVALPGPRPAAAQFYDLDGVYDCLTQPSAACQERQREHPPPPPPKPDPKAEVRSLDDAIAHVRSKTATSRDIEILEAHAADKDPRAIEVLAWCKLSGIGGEADIIAAYRLYGEAADLGVANARKNQIAIYETKLTPEQRHSVLLPQSAR
jgi:TPR repeat protein